MASLKRQGNCIFLIDQVGPDAVDAPMLAVGKVVVTATGAREDTQDPMTGFGCSDTPLGRGHIIALFLGGPDIAENYSPQYEQWQQSGAWKNMELSVRDTAQHLGPTQTLYMVVQLTYGRVGNTYLAEKAAFATGEIHEWTDARIPSQFHVWTFLASAPGAAAVVSDLTSANVALATAAMRALPTKPFLALLQAFDVTQMPVEDYRFWLRNLIRNWARERSAQALKDYRDEYTVGLVNMLKPDLLAKKPKSTGLVGVTKAKTAKMPAPTGSGRLSRAQTSALEAALQKKYHFNAALSTDAWMLSNIDKIVTHIRGKLIASTFGIRAPEITQLQGAGAAGLVTQQLT